MGEKFNSGYGGYICDTCRTLLWAGFDAKRSPSKRYYIYSATPESIVENEDHAFCSQECKSKYNETK